MPDIEFANGYRAALVYNAYVNEYTLRLYDKDNISVASIPSTPDTYEISAKALMTGYFFGVTRGRAEVKKQIAEIIRN